MILFENHPAKWGDYTIDAFANSHHDDEEWPKTVEYPHSVHFHGGDNLSVETLANSDRDAWRTLVGFSEGTGLLDTDPNEAKHAQGFLYPGPFSNSYASFLKEIISSEAGNSSAIELRAISIPRLKIDAFWLKGASEDISEDRFRLMKYDYASQNYGIIEHSCASFVDFIRDENERYVAAYEQSTKDAIARGLDPSNLRG